MGKGDLPFYDGLPVELGGRGWAIVLAAVVLAFLQLILAPWSDAFWGFAGPVLFTGLPLVALRLVAGPGWTALFGPYGFRAFGASVGFAILTLISSLLAGFVLSRLMAMTPNATIAMERDKVGLALLLGRAAVQLVGEEAVTILPLLAVLWFCVRRLGWSRRAGLVTAVVVSTLWFSAMHLPTYNWNLLQCLLTIGTARLALTVAYLVTRNMWVSVGAHILNDWTLFFIGFAGAHGPVAGA